MLYATQYQRGKPRRLHLSKDCHKLATADEVVKLRTKEARSIPKCRFCYPVEDL